MIRKLNVRNARNIAAIHHYSMKEAFFSKLGHNFLTYLYSKFLNKKLNNNFFGYSFTDKNSKEICGFITVAVGGDFFSKFLRQNAFSFILNVFKGVARNPLVIPRLFQTMFCLLKDNIKEESEIFSIAVKENHQGKRIGSKLIKSVVRELHRKKIKGLKVLVDAGLSANKFYKKEGFSLVKGANSLGRTINIYTLNLQ